jgi:SAM-dependent methyltransferase
MAQNIYDNEAFFKEYVQLPRQVKGLVGTPEWPALQDMIPDLKGADVLDLGCGFGWVCRWAKEEGASTVLGIDISEKMLSKARSFPTDPAITYLQADLEVVSLTEQITKKFDVVFSSLTLHYIEDIASLFSQISLALKEGGAFVFSIEHPIFSAPRNAKFIQDSDGHNVWPLDRYLEEGPRTTNWLADGVIKQHRTISSWIMKLAGAGFTLQNIKEWGPSSKQIEENPAWADERQRPPFLLIHATKGEPLRQQVNRRTP